MAMIGATHVGESFFQKCYWAVKRARIKATNWEYWPTYVVYGPLYFYWCWLSIRSRSFFFFSAANPGIQYSGFVQEKKSDIYKIIPQQYYPRTRLCTPGEAVPMLMEELKNMGLTFPLIAKPDMGQKGIQVKLLKSEEDLAAYSRASQVNFLVQEYVSYEHEVGIFYYRIPGEERGHISGIVGKEFLTVTGDGRSSMLSLLQQDDRSLLQLPALKHTYGDFLNTVLAKDVSYVVVPYGNHSRGAKFIDLRHQITDQLTQAIDQVCQQIPGFYYGRLDIKFNCWEEMTAGKNFSIIELNGAGSEPTHMYDPANSIAYAWKEIHRHWRLLFTISTLNARQKRLLLMNTTEGIRMIRDHFKHLRQIVKV
jgi:hypothetical protein